MLTASILCFVPLAAPSSQSADRFPGRLHVQPGWSERVALATGDLNGDGRDDLIATSGLSVLHAYVGKAGYGVKPGATLPIASPALALALGDVDGNGTKDLAFATVGKIFVALGDGFGGVSAPVQVGSISGCSDLEVVDVDSDGLDDVVALSETKSLVKVLLSSPTGGFLPPKSSTLGSLPLGFAFGDLDSDGWLDVVVASSGNGRIVTALGDGSGSFTKLQSKAVSGGPPTSIAIGDLDLDGDLDVVAGSTDPCKAYSMRGHGNGKFELPIEVLTGGEQVDLIDWNEDGYPDLVAACDSYGLLVVFNNGAGSFLAPTMVLDLNGACALATCDGDGDGHADLAYAAASLGDQASALPETVVGLVGGSGSGHAESMVFELTEGPAISGLYPLVEDFDQDGIVDVAGPGHDGLGSMQALVVRRGDGAGGLLAGEMVPPGVGEIAAGDVTGDGRTDLVASTGTGLSIIEWTPFGFETTASIASSGLPARVSLGDFEGDGDDDIVAFVSQRLVLWRSLGGGAFADPVVSGIPSSVQVSLEMDEPFRLVELDGDGLLDLVLTDDHQDALQTFRGLPSGRFAAWTSTDVETFGVDIEVVDLDGDGITEVVVARKYSVLPPHSSRLSIHRSDGQGGFKQDGEFEIGDIPLLLQSGDIDGDGHLDLLALLKGGRYAWIPGDGKGSFGPPTLYASYGLPIGVGDMNGDGLSDILMRTLNFLGLPPPTPVFAVILQH